MKRRRLILILLLFLLVGGLLLFPQVRWPVSGFLRGEAFYQGMPTSWWAKEVAKLEPFFTDRWSARLALIAGTWRPVGITSSLPANWFDELCETLGIAGARSAENAPGWRVLSICPGGPENGEVDPETVAVLHEMLDYPNPFVRWSALCSLEGGGICEVSMLTKAIHDEDLDVRLTAAVALVNRYSRGSLHTIEEPAVVAVLLEGIRHDSPDARCLSLFCIGILGPKAKTALPVLIGAWKDGSIGDVGSRLTDAINNIDPDAAAKAGVK